MHYQKLILICALSWMLINFPLKIAAQNNSDRARLESLDLQWSKDFSEDGRPKRTAGGASRGECTAENKSPLTALVPEANLGLTIAKSPSFWFYVPYTLTPQQSVEFVLKDDRDNRVYKMQYSGTGTAPGIVTIRLPSTVSLEVKKNYSWYFLVYCDSQNKDKFVFVNGFVRRIEHPDLNKQLASANPQERLILYANKGLWYDALNNLGDRLYTYPQDKTLRDDWKSLLRSVGLENLAGEPLEPISQ